MKYLVTATFRTRWMGSAAAFLLLLPVTTFAQRAENASSATTSNDTVTSAKPAAPATPEVPLAKMKTPFQQLSTEYTAMVDAEIATILSWRADSPGNSPSAKLLAGEKAQFESELGNRRTELIEALKADQATLTSRLAKNEPKALAEERMEAAHPKLLEVWDASQQRLARLQGPRIGSELIPWVKGFVAIAAIILVLGILALMISAPRQPEAPAGFVRGTVRAILALSISFVIMTFTLVSVFANVQVEGYLAAAFTSVIVFYFGARAAESYYATRPKTVQKTTSVDGSSHVVEAASAVEVCQILRAARPEQQEDPKLLEIANTLLDAEKRGLGSVSGVVTKAGGAAVESASVRVENSEIAAKTDAHGAYLLGLVPPGTVRVTVSGEGIQEKEDQVTLLPRGHASLPFNVRPAQTNAAPPEPA